MCCNRDLKRTAAIEKRFNGKKYLWAWKWVGLCYHPNVLDPDLGIYSATKRYKWSQGWNRAKTEFGTKLNNRHIVSKWDTISCGIHVVFSKLDALLAARSFESPRFGFLSLMRVKVFKDDLIGVGYLRNFGLLYNNICRADDVTWTSGVFTKVWLPHEEMKRVLNGSRLLLSV